MADLEMRLNAVCKGGFLLTLSLDCDAKGTWRATYRNTDNSRVNIEFDKDPVQAICKALTPLKQAKPAPVEMPSRKRVNEDLI